jgi:hypothetical protein
VLWGIGNTGENVAMLLDGFGIGVAFMLRRANGSATAPTQILNTQTLGSVNWRGYGASAYGLNVARVHAVAAQDWDNTHQGASLQFQVTPVGSTTMDTVARMGPGLTVGTPTAQASPAVGDINGSRVFDDGALLSPALGTAGQVQYYNAGLLAGSAGATFSAASLTGMNIALGTDATGDIYTGAPRCAHPSCRKATDGWYSSLVGCRAGRSYRSEAAQSPRQQSAAPMPASSRLLRQRSAATRRLPGRASPPARGSRYGPGIATQQSRADHRH